MNKNDFIEPIIFIANIFILALGCTLIQTFMELYPDGAQVYRWKFALACGLECFTVSALLYLYVKYRILKANRSALEERLQEVLDDRSNLRIQLSRLQHTTPQHSNQNSVTRIIRTYTNIRDLPSIGEEGVYYVVTSTPVNHRIYQWNARCQVYTIVLSIPEDVLASIETDANNFEADLRLRTASRRRESKSSSDDWLISHDTLIALKEKTKREPVSLINKIFRRNSK